MLQHSKGFCTGGSIHAALKRLCTVDHSLVDLHGGSGMQAPMLISCCIHGLVSMGYSTFNVHLRLDVACTFAALGACVRACVCVEFHGHVSLCTPWKLYVVYLML